MLRLDLEKLLASSCGDFHHELNDADIKGCPLIIYHVKLPFFVHYYK